MYRSSFALLSFAIALGACAAETSPESAEPQAPEVAEGRVAAEALPGDPPTTTCPEGQHVHCGGTIWKPDCQCVDDTPTPTPTPTPPKVIGIGGIGRIAPVGTLQQAAP